MNSVDGISIGWLGLPIFRTRTGQRLYPRRMPSFFESFRVILGGRATYSASGPTFPTELSTRYALERMGVWSDLQWWSVRWSAANEQGFSSIHCEESSVLSAVGVRSAVW